MRIELKPYGFRLFLWLVLSLAQSSIAFGQAGMEERMEITFSVRATGNLSLHVGTGAVYSNEPPYLPVILSQRFQSNVEIPYASQAALTEAYEKYQRAVGEYFILLSQGIAEKNDRLKVDEQINELGKVISGMPRTIVTQANEIATARNVILKCLKHPELLDYEQFNLLRRELAVIEKKAYEKLLSHCTDEQKKSFEALILSYHPNAVPLPSLLHDQLLASGAFAKSNAQTNGFRFTQACSVTASPNAGVGLRAEMVGQDLIFLIGALSDQSKSREVSEMFLQYEMDRSKVEKVDERLDLVRNLKSSVFAILSDTQQAELKEKLFAAHIRRFGIFAWDTSAENPPVALKPIFLPDSLKQIKSNATDVAKEIREAVNRKATMLIQSISNEKLPSLIDLNYPIPIEIVLSEAAP